MPRRPSYNRRLTASRPDLPLGYGTMNDSNEAVSGHSPEILVE